MLAQQCIHDVQEYYARAHRRILSRFQIRRYAGTCDSRIKLLKVMSINSGISSRDMMGMAAANLVATSMNATKCRSPPMPMSGSGPTESDEIASPRLYSCAVRECAPLRWLAAIHDEHDSCFGSFFATSGGQTASGFLAIVLSVSAGAWFKIWCHWAATGDRAGSDGWVSSFSGGTNTGGGSIARCFCARWIWLVLSPFPFAVSRASAWAEWR